MIRYLVLASVVLAFAAMGWLVFRYSQQRRSSSVAGWDDLLGRLVKVDREKTAVVALDLIDEEGNHRGTDWPELSQEQIWTLTGGLEGLERIASNCQVLIDIAVYIQATHPDALLVAEQLRKNAREIQWHLDRLLASERSGNLSANFAEYGQRAVATYFLMTNELVSLCEQAGFPGTEKLKFAVN